MKKAAILVFLAICLACTKESPVPQVYNTVLILKVDFLTHQFEGAIERKVSSPYSSSDSIPLGVDFKVPGDFGHIKVWYEPNSDSLFSGSVIALGEGQLDYPNVKPASQFTRNSSPLPMPDTTNFRHLIPNWYNQNVKLDSIWNDLANLDVVAQYLGSDSEIAYFLYTPGVWTGDPATWDYYLFMNGVK